MTRALLLVIPVVVTAAAVVGGIVPVPLAVILALAGGLATSAVLWAVERARIERLARSVNRWLGPEERSPIQVPATPAWRQLSVSLNALGAAYDRRGARLSRSARLREWFVDALPDPALLFDVAGALVRANHAARERFAIPEGGTGTVAQALGSPRLAEVVAEARGTGRTISVELILDERELRVLATPAGQEILLLVSDQTERRRVDAVRRDFVANASHELKTPVSGIQALAEGLEATIGRDPARAGALVRRLSDEAERLGKLVHDLLDLRRLEDDHDADRGPVDLTDLVRDEVERSERVAGERGVDLEVDIPDRAVVIGIEDDLRLVVANLLDNAIGYNRVGGSVRIELRPSGGSWRLRVSDTGIGISRQDLDRIFERFYRVDVARSRATGGTGLGLALVRHATERHGGAVSVDSILGEGTTFTVVLPIEPEP